MTALFLMLSWFALGPDSDTRTVQMQLQGLYDEISNTVLQFADESDVDAFHNVLYTSDWVFVDVDGQPHPWAEMRAPAVAAISEPPPESSIQRIEKVSLLPDRAIVNVKATLMRSVPDADGHNGRAQARSLTETTEFRDVWVKTGETWKCSARTQVGVPVVSVHKPE
jgi:hypothetical protein